VITPVHAAANAPPRRSAHLRSTPLEIPVDDLELIDALDLVFYGVDHTGDSYQARVYLGNSDADINTPLAPDEGFVGVFTVFGHHGCYGEVWSKLAGPDVVVTVVPVDVNGEDPQESDALVFERVRLLSLRRVAARSDSPVAHVVFADAELQS
jgi:hypothetical protein